MSGPHGESFSGRVGWGTTPAVVVVDLVRAYTQPEGPFALLDVGAAVAATQQLVDAARAHGHLVVWTVVRYAPGLEDATGGWGELTLKPEAGEPVVVKQYASAFFGTSLASTLRVAGVDTVVVTGVSTSGCVRRPHIRAAREQPHRSRRQVRRRHRPGGGARAPLSLLFNLPGP